MIQGMLFLLMSKVKIYFIYLVFSLLVFCQGKNNYLFAEISTNDESERIFKEAILEIEKFKNEEKQGMEPMPFTDWWADNEKMASAFNKLKTVTGEYPNSEWADDALYLHAYLMSPEPREAVNQLNKIIENYPDGKFEQWTLENCSTVSTIGILKKIPSWTLVHQVKSDLSLIYDVSLGEYKKALDLCEELLKKFKDIDYKGLLSLIYGNAMVLSFKVADLSKAENFLNEFTSKCSDQQLKDHMKKQFEFYKNLYGEKGASKPKEFKKLAEPEKKKVEELMKFIEEPLKKEDTGE